MVVSKMSTTTKIVYRLKDEGLVETYSCEDDARITRVVLTEKGMEMTHKINDLTNVVLEQSFEGLTPLQIEKLWKAYAISLKTWLVKYFSILNLAGEINNTFYNN